MTLPNPWLSHEAFRRFPVLIAPAFFYCGGLCKADSNDGIQNTAILSIESREMGFASFFHL